MRCFIKITLLCGFLMVWFVTDVQAATMDDYDFTHLDEWDDEKIFDIDFKTLVSQMLNQEGNGREIYHIIVNFAIKEIHSYWKTFLVIIGIVIVSSIFKSLTSVLYDQSISKVGILLTYIAILTMLYQEFCICFDLTFTTMEKMMDFLYSLFPTFFCAVSFCNGSLSATLLYQWTGVVLTLLNYVLFHWFLPLVKYYVLFSIVNEASSPKRFSNLCRLAKKIIVLGNRIMISIVLGINTVKTLTIPLTDSIKSSLFRKMLGSIPGIGSGVEGVAQTLTGSGQLIKNTIGVCGLIIIVLIAILPLCKLMVLNLMTHFLAAITEPVSDTKVVNGISCISDGIGILQYFICTSCIIFFVLIGMICLTTGMGTV